MTKMSKTQRTAILDFHNGVTAKGHTFIADSRTITALIRNGWAWSQEGRRCGRCRGTSRHAYVTMAGLIEAGVDMGAIETEAAAEHAARGHVDNRANRLPEVSGRWAGATDVERAELLKVAHAEARTEDRRRRVAAARQGHPEALAEMILAVLPLAIEQAHGEALDEHETRAHERCANLGVWTPATSTEIAQAYADLDRAREVHDALPDVSTWATRRA